MYKLNEKQIERLLNEVEVAIKSGETRCSVFEKTAQKYGLAKGSVRNVYYKRLKDCENKNISIKDVKKFTKSEELWLIKRVINERKNYSSMREMFINFANGDKKLALRFQNKYSVMIKNNRALVVKEMFLRKREGCDCFNPYIDKKVQNERTKLKREIDLIIKKITKKCAKENAELKIKLEKYEMLSNLTNFCDLTLEKSNEIRSEVEVN